MNESDLYNPEFVRSVFEEMSGTYGVVNFITSFGFTRRWRRQCVDHASIVPGMTVCDLMTGQGEAWRSIGRALQGQGRIVALDFSAEMCARAEKQKRYCAPLDVQLLEEDVLENSIESNAVDCVVSTFGLKTFSDGQKRRVLEEIRRILKPGGVFSLMEISVPASAMLRVPYLAYLSYGIPVAGKLFMGNPENYRMLGRYTRRFQNCRHVQEIGQDLGLETEYRPLFFGCGSLVYGKKPA